MRTVITVDIDGYEVVKGFDRPVIDPGATKAKAKKWLAEQPQAKTIEDLAETIRTSKDRHQQIKDRQKLQEMLRTSALKYLGYVRENTQYCHPKPGEYMITEQEFHRLKAVSVAPGFVLLRDGSLLRDDRGKFFWHKEKDRWVKTKIRKLGFSLPQDSAFFEDLSSGDQEQIVEQYRSDPIGTLSEADKDDQYNLTLERIKQKASEELRKLKAVGDPEAEKNVEKILKASIKNLNEKFGRSGG